MEKMVFNSCATEQGEKDDQRRVNICVIITVDLDLNDPSSTWILQLNSMTYN